MALTVQLGGSGTRPCLYDMVLSSIRSACVPRRINPNYYYGYPSEFDDYYDDDVDLSNLPYDCYGDCVDMDKLPFDDYGDDADLLYPQGVIKPSVSGGKSGKVIWFYPDYHAEDDRLEYDDLVSFVDFCRDESIQLPLTFYTEYSRAGVNSIHCCLDPLMRSVGRKVLCHGMSYGDLFYEVCDACEL